MANTSVLDGLIQALHRLPGVGVKSASRMAYHLLQHDREGAKLIADALQTAVAEVQHCESCNTFTTQPI
ncbi:MAG: recombination protein RecR, partial [Betaproteobacteria bacterium]